MKSTGNDSWQREGARSSTESEGEQRRVEQRADISCLKNTLLKWVQYRRAIIKNRLS